MLGFIGPSGEGEGTVYSHRTPGPWPHHLAAVCIWKRVSPRESSINTEPSEESDAEGGARAAEDAAALCGS